jgi:hypothetical protein
MSCAASSFGFPGAFFREQMVGGQVIGAKSRTKGTWKREIDSSGSAAQEFVLECPVEKISEKMVILDDLYKRNEEKCKINCLKCLTSFVIGYTCH